MEDIQETLTSFDKNLRFENFRTLVKLKPNPKALEQEKRNFIDFMFSFIEGVDFEEDQCIGRPRFSIRDIIKSLLVMCYNGMSYRRTEPDLIDLKEKGIIKYVPSRSLLNKYMLLEETKKIMEKLIQMSSLFFIENEDTLIVDSTWLSPRMYSGGYKRVYDKKSTSLQKVRKLHVACLKNSRIICCAKATEGTLHDSRMFEELISTPIKNGFMIRKLLADAGYAGKENYALAQSLNIRSVFIDFRKNATSKHAKSQTYINQLKMFKEEPEQWHESYRFRVLIEGIFSAIKRKHTNYLRSRKDCSQDVELLLKCLVYNLIVSCKYFMDSS